MMFNPVIVSKRDMYETEEGCLSLDGVRKTTRYQEIEVEYYDFKWKNSARNCQDGQHRFASMKLIIVWKDYLTACGLRIFADSKRL